MCQDTNKNSLSSQQVSGLDQISKVLEQGLDLLFL